VARRIRGVQLQIFTRRRQKQQQQQQYQQKMFVETQQQRSSSSAGDGTSTGTIIGGDLPNKRPKVAIRQLPMLLRRRIAQCIVPGPMRATATL